MALRNSTKKIIKQGEVRKNKAQKESEKKMKTMMKTKKSEDKDLERKREKMSKVRLKRK